MFLILSKLYIPPPLVDSGVLVASQCSCGWSRLIYELISVLLSEFDPRASQ